MFFNLSKAKIVRIGIVFGFLISSIWVSFSLGNRFKIGDTSSLYFKSQTESFSYWWSNKFLPNLNLRNPSLFMASLMGMVTKNDVVAVNKGEIARSIPVLVYHGIPDEGGGDNPFSSLNFADQMKILKNAGWNTITLSQFKSFINSEISLPEKSFLLTFDDGRKDTFYPSDPVLKDLGFNAVMFAITKNSLTPGSSKSSYYLSEFELNEMQKSGRWEIESHGRDSHDWYSLDDKETIGHFFSNRLWLPDQKRVETEQEFRDRTTYDLANSKKDLENALDKKVTAFAFPFSDYGENTVNFPLAESIISEEVPKYYNLAFYQVWYTTGETFNFPNAGKYMIRRLEPESNWTPEILRDKLESGISKDLPFSENIFGMEWIQNWGIVTTGSSLKLEANKNTTGATAALNGSWWWKNYTFTSDVNWQAGSNVVLTARRTDDHTYFGCNFSKNKVSIKHSLDGNSQNILTSTIDLSTKLPHNLGIRVSGESIQCLVDNQVVLAGDNLNTTINNGGIGLEVWDSRTGLASATFNNISVIPE